MSRWLVCLALCASFFDFFPGAASAAEQETAARPLPAAGRAKILATLSQPTEFAFDEVPFAKVIDHFKQKHNIEILLDKRALSDAGVGTEVPIYAALKGLSLRSALRLILGQLDLTYVTRDGYLLITSKTEAESNSMLSFQAYPVHDLVTLDSGFRPLAYKQGGQGDSPLLKEVLAGFGRVGSGVGNGASQPDASGDFQELIDVIMATIAQATWDEVGGPGAITENLNAQAVAISQTEEVHEEIVELLAALRRVRDEQIAVAEPLTQAPPDVSGTEKPLQVRAYRLMRGTASPTKSGWRPPVKFVGDARTPRAKKASAEKPKATAATGEGGAKEATPAKETPAASDAETKDATPAQPKDEKLEVLAEKIAALVPQMIEPGSWEPSGEGMIRAVGEGVVVRHNADVQRLVAGLIAELLPDCVPLGFTGPWGPWKIGVPAYQPDVRLRPATTGNWPQQAEPRPRGQVALIHAALAEKCDVESRQLPLIDALRPAGKPRQVPVFIDRMALTDAGVDIEKPVACPITGLSYRETLKILLDELDLTYVIRDEALVITSKKEAESTLSTKVYPVFDLVVRPPHVSSNRNALDFQSLIRGITSNIAPTTWDEVGGPGAIREFTNSAALVISQTTQIHEEIAEYLRAVREAGAAATH